MNIIAANQNLTMSSREIAKLTEKEHKHVIRDTRNMLDSLGIEQSPYLDFDNSGANGREVSFFVLPKDLTITLVSGYNVKMRHAITKRWLELENGQRFQIPQTLGEALQLAADQAKELELAAPKVAFVDNFVETGTTKTLRETAKILNYPERKMIALMIDHDILYRMSGKLLPYQKYHEQKLFEVKTGERNGHAFTQTRVTTKGLTWLGERYASDLMEDK